MIHTSAWLIGLSKVADQCQSLLRLLSGSVVSGQVPCPSAVMSVERAYATVLRVVYDAVIQRVQVESARM